MKYFWEEVITLMFQIEDKRKYLRVFNVVICMALFLWSYDATITSYNTTLLAFSYKYGFILRYPEDKKEITGINSEPWHYRYVGTKAAREIYTLGICLEEYLELFDETYTNEMITWQKNH